jgi:hypothetical protein
VTGVREVFSKDGAAGGPISALGPLTDARGEFLDVIEHLAALGHFGEDLSLGVHHGGVVTTERLADLRQRKIGELAAQVHRDLS